MLHGCNYRFRFRVHVADNCPELSVWPPFNLVNQFDVDSDIAESFLQPLGNEVGVLYGVVGVRHNAYPQHVEHVLNNLRLADCQAEEDRINVEDAPAITSNEIIADSTHDSFQTGHGATTAACIRSGQGSAIPHLVADQGHVGIQPRG